MNVIYINSTELKQNSAHILNEVLYGKKEAIISRHGKTIAKIIPYIEKVSDEEQKNTLSSLYGSIPDFPDVTKLRRSRKKTVLI